MIKHSKFTVRVLYANEVVLQDGGTIGAGVVVNTAGASGVVEMAQQVGVSLPIETRKRCTFIFSCREQLEAMPMTFLPQGIGCRPEGRGFLVNTSPPPERDPIVENDDFEVDYYIFDEIIWPALAERIPAFGGDQTGKCLFLSLRLQHA